jgi:hypothetical protein
VARAGLLAEAGAMHDKNMLLQAEFLYEDFVTFRDL